jgi:hypothetical protein
VLTFNLLLDAEGILPSQTRLIRHQDQRGSSGCTPYHLWKAGDGSFERYQSIQSRERFEVGGWLASFVVTPFGETLFAGMYRVTGLGVAAEGETDPVGGHDVAGLHEYVIEPVAALAEHVGRLIIEWGEAYRSWVQRADRQDKRILELRREISEPPFPGFDGFVHTIRTLATVPQTWRTALSAVSGVYLLVSLTTGKQYVGSAVGAEGFWGRWVAYAANGHGGNVGLRLATEQDYQVSILEVAASTATRDDVLALESTWKDKLLSRRFGLNRN